MLGAIHACPPLAGIALTGIAPTLKEISKLRANGRQYDQIRATSITRNYLKHPEGSVLIEMGDTKVICTASIDENVPPHCKGTGSGWITAEYGMLPRSTLTRMKREGISGKAKGRTQEIQRLIGRSLRSVADLKLLGERTIYIDTDVIQADGGTRTAAITGSFLALKDAINRLIKASKIKQDPIKEFIAAVSVGIVNGNTLLDLDYSEDFGAEVDMNIVMTESEKFVEIQGTAEKAPFSNREMLSMLEAAKGGIRQLIEIQKDILGRGNS